MIQWQLRAWVHHEPCTTAQRLERQRQRLDGFTDARQPRQAEVDRADGIDDLQARLGLLAVT